jgi:histone demethylase JARID1
MVPWMYVGMMYSAFCWHIEDHMFYSINYMHWGEAKRWYSVPAYATAAFEAAFQEWLPDQMAMQPDLLFQLVTLLSPEKLNQSGVPVYGLVQEAHDFVVTFPCAYHGGFNTGFNCAEAVNFCPPDWLRFGSVSQERYRHFRRPPVLSLEELILKCSAEGDLSPEAAAWMAIELERVSEDERALRTGLWAKGVKRASRVEQEAGLVRAPQHIMTVRCVSMRKIKREIQGINGVDRVTDVFHILMISMHVTGISRVSYIFYHCIDPLCT